MDNGHEPATKNDLLDLRSELRSEHKNDISALGDELREAIHDSETRMLRAFYSYAEANLKRLSNIETDQSGVQARLGIFEARLLEVEKRLNMPPQS